MGIIKDLWEFCENRFPNSKFYLEDWFKLFPQYKPPIRNKIKDLMWKNKKDDSEDK